MYEGDSTVSGNSLEFIADNIKELVRYFSFAYIELWMHARSLESTKEA